MFGLTRAGSLFFSLLFLFIFFYLFSLASMLCNRTPFSPSLLLQGGVPGGPLATHPQGSLLLSLEPGPLHSTWISGFHLTFSLELHFQPVSFSFPFWLPPSFSGKGQHASGKMVADLFPVSTLLCDLGLVTVPLWVSKRLDSWDQDFSRSSLLIARMSSSELVKNTKSLGPSLDELAPKLRRGIWESALY